MTLTQKDFDQIEELTRGIVKEEIKNLPTKEEFFSKMDEVMGELETVREEQTVLSGQVSNHENRLKSFEKIHPEVATP